MRVGEAMNRGGRHSDDEDSFGPCFECGRWSALDDDGCCMRCDAESQAHAADEAMFASEFDEYGEPISDHADDCASGLGGPCDCGAGTWHG